METKRIRDLLLSQASFMEAQIIELRDAFARTYCAEREWDIENLSIEQLLEIRSQPGWKDVEVRNLAQAHMNQAYKWFQKHQNHVYQLVENAKGSYMPTGIDCACPELWKPEHWQWFIAELTE